MSKVLCMEIGTSIIRISEVQHKGKTVEILDTFVFDTPDDATKDGKVRVSDEIVAAIRDGLDESGMQSKDVYFIVESTKILFKQVELPFVKKSLIAGTLELSLSELFPVDETLYHPSYTLEKVYEKNGQKMMALDVFAIPNDLSESYYNLSVALGLNAKGLSDSSRSMMSLFPSSFKNRNVAMVNINENVSTLSIAIDGDMVFNKTIPHGVSDALRLIANSSLTMDDLDMTTAAEFLYTQNILMKQIPSGLNEGSSIEEQLRYNVTTSIVSLVKAIEATFTAFLTKEKIQIQEFQLSGLGAGFAGISQLLTYEFGIPVTVIQQEGNLKINKNAVSDTLLLACYPSVGSILDPINFFTKDEQAGGEVAHRKKVDQTFLFVGILICLVAFGYGSYSWIHTGIERQDAYDENTRLNKRVQELRDLGVEIAYNNYSTALSYNEQVHALYDGTKSENEEMTVFLEELEKLLPQSARVTSIKLAPTSASVTFSCDNKFVASGVLHLLRNMKTTVSMECNGVAEVEGTQEVTFSANFVLKTPEELNPNGSDSQNSVIDESVKNDESNENITIEDQGESNSEELLPEEQESIGETGANGDTNNGSIESGDNNDSGLDGGMGAEMEGGF